MSSVQDRVIQTLSEKGAMTTKELSKVVYPTNPECKRHYSTSNRLSAKLNKLEKFGIIRRVGEVKENGVGGNISIIWDLVRE